MSPRALIIGNGEPPSRSLARRLASRVDLIVAADGGANVARRFGIRPHVIIGDLDSITQSTRRFFSPSSILQVQRQDNTDLEKALDYLSTTAFKDVSIIGATGKRIDSTFGNFSVIWKYTSFMRLAFVGDGWRATPVESGKPIPAKPGTVVSLIPFGACYGITLKGLKYMLTNATMKMGEIAVSNVVTTSPFRVSLRRGRMLLFIMDRT